MWRRFRDTTDAYAVLRRDGLVGVRAVGNAEAMVELFIALVPECPDPVALSVDDWRGGRSWRADAVTQAGFLDAFYPLRVPMIGAGGIEITLEAGGEQLSLSAHLEVVAWARTDRWIYLLDRAGLRERPRVRGRLWRPARGAFPPAAMLDAGIATLVEQLAMTPA
ncbi:MAG: hypothetical protein IT355_09890 [Gemmatimonadaceae bacterium]|nr:hypothetical protein [Gemmatimonadaceae bacterium]